MMMNDDDGLWTPNGCTDGCTLVATIEVVVVAVGGVIAVTVWDVCNDAVVLHVTSM